MITEQEKQEILNGAYGITRNGFKCKYIGTNTLQRYVFAFFNDKDEILHVIDMLGKFNRFKHAEEGEFDVVGLWKDKPEPFDLKRALNGKPLIDLHNNEKCWLYKSHKNGNLIIEYENTDSHLENIEPLEYLHNDLDLSKCFSMWKDPQLKSNTITLTLPCPLREPRDEMWFLTFDDYMKSAYGKNIPLDNFKRKHYFGSEADAQAWIDALKNSRR
ncbi:hypothetical protein [Glaesserella parasuis]|uniref:Uncharacterized protein n=1 Tax=Glaesserella parasuis TaxID=738 RepID=A0AAJ6ACN3_GLAPU|nr:hypothetical protein [Glaesserella parasuis]MDG6310842.1 hypothetical protein [Glaesserella parasuis]MDG6360688.1 hypothetical protein [Glaesserella parasuis]MDG6409174.1 hypothetical protein [Glaesserella parasuis]MDG6451512.1 hypothetical protein [Glaesserella parasuis]MDG6471001.1 hypothetical protein [Glaesserella parasuis]